MQKDYWNISKRNFRAMGIISLIFAVLLGITAMDSRATDVAQAKLMIPVAFFIVSAVLFMVIATLFKKHSPKAIAVGYGYVGLAFIVSIIYNFILSSPADGILSKVLGLLVLVYLFVNIQKASKQNPVVIQ